MTEDQDNAGEVVAGVVRVALTAAGQLAEQAARRRDVDLREAERHSAARLATLQSQLAAERELAQRSVRDVVQRGDLASVDEVVRAWEQARSWDDPTIAAERTELENRIRKRFGVDLPVVAAGQSRGHQAEASAVITRDVNLQLEDAHHRATAQDRTLAGQGALVASGIDEQALAARALAAESHPVAAASAARKPSAVPADRRPLNKRGKAVEVQGPGR